MTKYIDAEKLIVEIERQKIGYNTDGNHAAEYETCKKILNITNSLQQEQPEVDLEKEFEDYLDNVEGQPRMWHPDEQIEWAKDIARHFFELGIKAGKEE